MKETLLNLLFIISKVPLMSHLIRFMYWVNVSLAIFLLKRNKSNEGIFIKGGYARGDFELIVSDIDLVVINKNKHHSSWIKTLCPLVKDIDVYSHEEFEERLRYGSLKYSDKEYWIARKGEMPDLDYLFHPQKIKDDLIQEVYFYYEWIFENFKKGKLNSYRKACLTRNLRKVRSSILSIVNDGELSALANQVETKNFKSKGEFVKAFVELISLLPIIEEEMEPDQYIKDNFNFSEELPNVFEKIYLNQRLFKLFNSCGALNTFTIYKNAMDEKNPIQKHLKILSYKLKILDGKTNHIHRDLADIQLLERIAQAKDVLDQLEIFNFKELPAQKVVYITASWGNDYLNRLYETHQANLNTLGNQMLYYHVTLGGDRKFLKSMRTICTIRVEPNEEYKGLWHKESLFNLAINFLENAQISIFSDIDAVIRESDWLIKLKDELINKSEVIQPFSTFKDEKTGEITFSSIAALDKKEDVFFAPGLMWAFNQSGLKKLGQFYDFFHDGSNDGILFKEVTKTHIGMVENFDWINKNIESYITGDHFKYSFIDYELLHISHPQPKHYINMIVFFNLILPLLSEAIEKSDTGLWKWKNDVDKDLKLLFTQFRADRGYASQKFLNSVKKKIKSLLTTKIQPCTLYLNDHKNIYSESAPGSLSMFVGVNVKGMSFYACALDGNLETSVIHHLDKFEKDKTYSLSFIIESEQDLEQNLVLKLKQSHLDNVIFNFKKLTNNLWYTTINFFAWQDFPEPILDFSLKSLPVALVKFNHYQIEAVPENKPWEWFTESKSEVKEVSKQHSLEINASFAPNWYKVVIKIDGDISKYQVSVKDSHQTNVLLPRHQDPANDYMTFYFKSIVTVESIIFDLEFDQASSYVHDVVIYH